MEFDLNNKKILAPLSGINDIAFRTLVKDYGADITSIGLVSAEALIRANKTTLELIKTSDDRPTIIQLFGDDEYKIKKAVKIVEPYADIIDFNLGCPSYNIIKQGYGAYLLQYPSRIYRIFKAMKSTTNKPITAKIRAGLNEINYIKTLEIIKIFEKLELSAITIHPRSAKQGYSGKADWNLIRFINKRTNLLIIGNGDLFRCEDIENMKAYTGINSVMIGRAAMGNPFIFICKDKKSVNEIKKAFMKYISYAKRYNVIKDFSHIRMQALFFFKGFKGSSELRAKISKSKDLDELLNIIKDLNL